MRPSAPGRRSPVWGTWFIVTFALGAGAVLLVVGLAFGGWPVLIALAVFAAIGAALLVGASFRRSRQYVEGGDATEVPSTDGREDTGAGQGVPRSGGAPASGEGS